MRIECKVTIDLKEPAKPSEIRDYIRTALNEFGGEFHTSSPFFPTKIRAMPAGIKKVRKIRKA
jgi:hypothetical protein